MGSVNGVNGVNGVVKLDSVVIIRTLLFIGA